MNRFPVRRSLAALRRRPGSRCLPPAAAPATTAPAGAKKMAFKLTDAGCDPHNAKAPAGPITFEVENAGSARSPSSRCLTAKRSWARCENLSDGLSGSFSLTLEEGEYTLRCNGGDEEDGTLTVTGGADRETSPEVEAAIAQYREYLEENTTSWSPPTEPFVAAVERRRSRQGQDPVRRRPHPLRADRAGGRVLRRPRPPHRRPRKRRAGRMNSAASTGSRRRSGRKTRRRHGAGRRSSCSPTSKNWQQKVKTVDLQAVQIANGANELLGEVSASKITGEEERYSHIDLVDFEANVEGAEAAFEAVEPLLDEKDPKLAKEIEASFEDVYASLKPYRRGERLRPLHAS